MKKVFFFCIIASVSLLFSCKVIQVYETKPASGMIKDEGYYTYENDTIKIMYSFWEDKGVLSFSFYNKLSIPIYIDWKKCSFLRNGEKLDFWIDETNTKSIAASSGRYGSRIFYGDYDLLNAGVTSNIMMGNSKSIKPQRVVFIAPKSKITKFDFELYPYKVSKIGSEGTTVTVRKPNSTKEVKVKSVEYSQENSPLVFRNFLSISTKENFENEYYIDNTFYVSSKKDFKRNIFDLNKQPFKNAKWFYVDT